MRSLLFVISIICLWSASSCARPAVGESSQQEAQNSKPSKQAAPAAPAVPPPTSFSRDIPATFPAYTPEVEKEIKSLKPGQWIPITIDREYLILRYSGIRLERGPYFVQLLSDPMGNVTKFLIAKKRDIRLQDVNLAKAMAKDGSFAEVMNFDGAGRMSERYKDTRAFVVSSGERGAVWVQVMGSDAAWEGGVMGLANRSKTLKVAQ